MCGQMSQHRASERLTPPLSGGHPPAPGSRAVLGLPLDATRGEAQRAFRRLAKQTHPDGGGDATAFRAVAAAWADLAATLPSAPAVVGADLGAAGPAGARKAVACSGPAAVYRAVAGNAEPMGGVVWAERRPPVRRPTARRDFARVLAAELARQAA